MSARPSNVVVLPGCLPPVTGEPNPAVIVTLERLLEKARRGDLQSMVGTGFLTDGERLSFHAGHHTNIYEMRGAISFLEEEYLDRIAEWDLDQPVGPEAV